MRIVFTLLLSCTLLLSQAALTHAEEMRYGVPAPTLFEIAAEDVTTTKPLITGVTFNETVVDIYIDGVFNGKANVEPGPEGVASFAYNPFLDLAPGTHTIFAVARSLDQTVRSKESAYLTISVPEFPNTPFDIATEVDETGKSRITGFIANNTAVEISINGREFVTFTPPVATTGSVTSFWYRPGLPTGSYTVSVRPVSNDGTKGPAVSQELPFIMGEATTESESIVMEDPEPVVVVEPEPITEPVMVDDPRDVLDDLESQEDPIEIIDESENGPDVVVDDSETEDTVELSEGEEDREVVLADEETSDDETIIFGEDATIDEGVAEEVAEGNASNVSRIAGFLLLLVIAIVLALWYVREKELDKEAQKDNMQTSFDDLSKKKETKTSESAEVAKPEVDKQQSTNQQNNQQHNHSKKKRKKHKRRR
ncbi:MAG: hypothetical protein ACPGO5_03810 [Patescibacteria group bacterium]